MAGYSTKFQGSAAVERYMRKLDNRIDRLRHEVEAAMLTQHAHGELFDCTIGIGRFVGKLPRVTSYSGMDLSQEFVNYVQETYPSIVARVGDLTDRIEQPSDRYDTVLLLRSLSAIGHEQQILAEMVRIAKPGGAVIFDYGTKSSRTIIYGKECEVDGAPIEEIVRTLPIDVEACARVDGVLTRLKKYPRVFRALHSRAGHLIPDAMLSLAERLLTPFIAERQVYIVRKRPR